jgi:uncharacterized RDD family membrane protein YckC/Tfp pilus assembly protein PilE
MFCPACGSQVVQPGAQFCASCGRALPAATLANAPPVQPAGPSPTPAETGAPFQGPVYAGFWKRLVASLIDSFILGAFGFVIGLAYGIVVAPPPGEVDSTFLLLQFALGVLGFVYFAWFESSSAQATWGKQALGIKVTDEAGERQSFGRALGRNLLKIVSYLVLFVGFLMAGWTRRKQALHDMLSGSLIVNAAALRAGAVEAPGAASRISTGAALGIALASIFVGVFVIGVLAAIAIPQYQDYVTRARLAETYSHGMAAARLVGDFYEKRADIPDTLEALDYSAPPGFQVSLDPTNGVVTARHASGTVVLTFTPSARNGKVQWHCDPGELRRNQTGSICPPPEKKATQ